MNIERNTSFETNADISSRGNPMSLLKQRRSTVNRENEPAIVGRIKANHNI